MSPIYFAIEGCGHGTLHSIYASVEESRKQKNWPTVDLLIICGDFQSVRNAYDLHCVNMPAKYRAMHDFHEYYSGARKAPFLTIFVGGNHEATNYLFELSYGGWVAPNIYYLGAANLVRFGPLRIAGLSGIWKGYDYPKPHFERLPYNDDDLRSIYHVRKVDVRKLLQVRDQVDIGISHDWPRDVVWSGNHTQLFAFKKHLREDAQQGMLGSVAAREILNHLCPTFWFSAHLHCKYAAVVKRVANEDEVDLDGEGDHDGKDKETKFLALDKCLPQRHFLQLLEVPTEKELDRPLKLEYDPEWLAITRAFALSEPLTLGDPNASIPLQKSDEKYRELVGKQRAWVNENLSDLRIPENFEVSAPVYDGGDWRQPEYRRVEEFPNPQTAAFCDMLKIENAYDISPEDREARLNAGPRQSSRDHGARGDRGRGRGRGRGGRRGR
ncbi:DBR1-domain-containing protein [Piedraia hortae CBS 480.64]|uniref:DBR1-domain-containing protein n=1 Tax=Piedraia hortae CBS 480.64 TaxID=1314780 RepID=A0A6A7C2K2_9PEZI|nr:DBR1-domain-containing protein [Piedraia hortae CBS 480.64]